MLIIFYLLKKTEDFTIVVLGKGTVGKTSLIFQYIKKSCPTDHDPTVEDSYTTQIRTFTGEERQFKILDTAGEDDYQTMIDEWIKAANGFLLLFAINDKESFEALKAKVVRIKKNNKGDLPIILVGNKCDLESSREVEKQSAVDYAKTIGAKYYETSALNDRNGNVKIVFQQCAHLIVSKFNSESKGGSCPCIIC
jgi:small GTP-binding protein